MVRRRRCANTRFNLVFDTLQYRVADPNLSTSVKFSFFDVMTFVLTGFYGGALIASNSTKLAVYLNIFMADARLLAVFEFASTAIMFMIVPLMGYLCDQGALNGLCFRNVAEWGRRASSSCVRSFHF